MTPWKTTFIIFAMLSLSALLADDFKPMDSKKYKDASPTSQALIEALKARNKNPAGMMSGAYIDSSGALHSFTLTLNGTFTSFDAAVAREGSDQGTQSENRNPAGEIVGGYIDSSGALYNFVLTPDGVCTSAPLRGARPGPPRQINPACIPLCFKPTGPVTEEYIDASNVFHGSVRMPEGTIICFDAPGAGTGPGQGTIPTGINSAGMIQGTYIDSCGVNHGFLRGADGTITASDVPVADTGPDQRLTPKTTSTAVAEWYVDSSGVFHGFALTKNGALTTFDVPGVCNIPVGAITGWYIDTSGAFQGFLRSPQAK